MMVVVIILALVVLIGGWLIGSYNSLITMNEDVNNAWAQVETQYQRRVDLIPNLVETIKGYASHEKETFTKIAELRSGYQKAKTPSELQAVDAQLKSAINIAVEAYPQLKANENFLALQDELAGTENRISVARKDYNTIVTVFNKRVKQFPMNIISGMLGFEPRNLFEAAPGAENAPQVNFN